MAACRALKPGSEAYRACLPKGKDSDGEALQRPIDQVIHIAHHCNAFLQAVFTVSAAVLPF